MTTLGTALDRVTDALTSHGSKRQGPGAWQCPAHQDSRASLSVTDRDDRVLLRCHAGCTIDAILQALGLTRADLFNEPRNGNGTASGRPSIVATYDYTDEEGRLLFQVVRMAPKDFRQRRPDPTTRDGWNWRLGDTRRVPYRLPNVIQAVKEDRRVWIVEGEKDVHALEKAGETATCNPGGALKWRPEYNQHFHGADVVIVRDNDDPGHQHAQQVAEALDGIARTIRVVQAAAGKDAADHLGEGLTVDQFITDQPRRLTTYRSGLELFDAAPENPDWLWHGYVARGAVTLLAGMAKGGKSTLLFSMMGAFLDNRAAFLGHPITPGPVVLLTEEGPGTLRGKMEPITREGLTRLRVLTRDDVTPRLATWAESIREAGIEAHQHGAHLVVVDTFAFWSQIQDENAASLMQEAVAVLAELTAQGLAVIVVHHHRKQGGEGGTAIRGNTALLGAVDLIVELIRPPRPTKHDDDGDQDDTQSRDREIHAVGRYPDIPEAMRVRLSDDGTYQVIAEGTRAHVRRVGAMNIVADHVRDAYPDTPSIAEAQAATGLSHAAVTKALADLVRTGRVEVFGQSPKRHRWIP